MAHGRILIFVEDPGAANFIAPVLDSLTAAGWQITLSAAGLASTFLSDRGIPATVAPTGTDASEYLKDTGANLLMVGTAENPGTFAFPLTQAAREAGVPSIGFVDGPANAQLRFRGYNSDPLTHVTDWLMLSDDHTADLFTALNHPRTHIAVTGHPYYDIVRTEAEQLRKQSVAEHRTETLGVVPVDRPVIVFLGEGSDGLGMDIKRRSSDYTLTGRGSSDRRTEIVLEEFLDAVDTLDCDPYLVFRAHPKDPASHYETYIDRFDAVSEGGRPLQLLFAADLVVGLSTSLLVEAALAGLNTLSILPAENQKHLIPTVLRGLTPCATDRGTLQELLPRLLAESGSDRHQGAPASGPNATAQVVNAVELIAGRG
ncbi:MAG: hypothetical protein HOK98_14745 [Rhodospirillaceae bacterium]|jgi:hypothetical protein|nr:hypothetical protein [Rhodospirillaceae bacterium]